MRRAYAHDATVRLAPGGDESAPGAAITVALCGHWDHEPPCPLAPHHTRAERDGERLRLRTVFVVEPEREGLVRERIAAGLGSGTLLGPDGHTTQWQLCSAERAEPTAAECRQADLR